MRTSISKLILALSVSLSTAIAAPALAQEEGEGSGIVVSGNAALVTDYRFRGISFSNEKVAVQGGVDVTHDSGFYIGTWASSIADSVQFGQAELDIYGGWSGEISSGTVLDAGLLYYIFPDGDKNAPGSGPSDYFEPYVSIAHTIGPVEAKVGAAYAWKQSAIGNRDNIYIYGDLSAGIPQTPVSLNAHLGFTDGSLAAAGSGGSYMDWSLGADWAITQNLTFGLAYIDTDAPNARNVDAAIIATVGLSF